MRRPAWLCFSCKIRSVPRVTATHRKRRHSYKSRQETKPWLHWVYTLVTSWQRDTHKQNKHIYIHVCVQRSFILVPAESREATVIQRRRKPALFGLGGSTSPKDTDWWKLRSVCLWKLIFGQKVSTNTKVTTCQRETEALNHQDEPDWTPWAKTGFNVPNVTIYTLHEK